MYYNRLDSDMKISDRDPFILVDQLGWQCLTVLEHCSQECLRCLATVWWYHLELCCCCCWHLQHCWCYHYYWWPGVWFLLNWILGCWHSLQISIQILKHSNINGHKLTEELSKLVEDVKTSISSFINQEGRGSGSSGQVIDSWPEVSWVDRLQLLIIEWCLRSGDDTADDEEEQEEHPDNRWQVKMMMLMMTKMINLLLMVVLMMREMLLNWQIMRAMR